MGFDPTPNLLALARFGDGGVSIGQLIIDAMSGKLGDVGIEAIANLQAAAGDTNEPADASAAIAAAAGHPPADLAAALAGAMAGQPSAGVAAALAAVAAGTAAAGDPSAPAFQQAAAAAAAAANPSTPPADTPTDYTTWFSQLLDAIKQFLTWPDRLKVAAYKFVLDQGIAANNWTIVHIWGPAKTFLVATKQGLLQEFFGTTTVAEFFDTPTRVGFVGSGSGADEIAAAVAETNQVIANPQTAVERIFAAVMRWPVLLTAIGASLEPLIQDIKNQAQARNPNEPLTPPDSLQAARRGVWTDAQAIAEAEQSGLSAARYNVLRQSSIYLPSIPEASSWLAKGLITDARFTTIITHNDIDPADQTAIISAQIRDVEPRSLAESLTRSLAQNNPLLASALTSPPPAEVATLYTRANIDQRQAQVDWQNHWRIPNADYFFSGLFRGVFDLGDIQAIADANATPPGLLPGMIEQARPTLPARVIATLLSRGTISDAQAADRLAKLGYSQNDIALWLEYVVPKAPPKSKAPPADLSKVATTSASTLYDDGAISSAQYSEILAAHGMGPNAIALTIQATDLKNQVALRKAAALEMVDMVKLGQIDVPTLVQQMTLAGYSQREVTHYERMASKVRAANVKLPSYSQAAAMFKTAIWTEQQFGDFLVTLGYTAQYIPDLIALERSKDAPASTP